MKPYYEDSWVTIYHGDCREILVELPRGLIITDPPYNVGYHYASYSDNLSVSEYQELLKISCPAPCVLIHYAEDLVSFSITIGAAPDKIVAWVYPSNTPRQWRGVAWWGCRPDFELDGQPFRNPDDKRIAKKIEDGKQARLYDWWLIDQVKNIATEKTEHPCQIPISVMSRVIKITPSETIIDPFTGSGTTLRAAKDLGRKAIGIEIEERYCEIAALRMTQEVFNFSPNESNVTQRVTNPHHTRPYTR